jgi:hypothetical protein
MGTCILAYRLGLGSIRNPGAGLIPFGVAALLGLMSIGLLLRGLFRSTGGSQSEGVFKGVKWRGVGLTLCGLLGYGASFHILGFAFHFPNALAHRRGWPSKVVVSVYCFSFHRCMCVLNLCGLVGLSIPSRPFGNLI